MNRHLVLALIVALIAGSTALWWTQNAEAQNPVTDYTLYVPADMVQDTVNDISVLRYGADLTKALEVVGSQGVVAAFGDTSNKYSLYLFENEGDRGELNVYLYSPSSKEFQRLDCSNEWFGGAETPDVYSNILKDFAGKKITISDFLSYPKHDGCDSWAFAYSPDVYSEFRSGMVQANAEIRKAYTKDDLLNLVSPPAAVTNPINPATPSTTPAATTPIQVTTTINNPSVVSITNGIASIPLKVGAAYPESLENTQYTFKLSGGDERYLLHVWKAKKLDLANGYEVGARLFLIDNGNLVEAWPYFTIKNAYSVIGEAIGEREIQAGSQTAVVKLPTDLTFTSGVKGTSTNRGKIVVTFNSTLGTTINFTNDIDFEKRNVARFGLSDDLFAKIKKLSPYAGYATAKDLIESGKVKIKLEKIGSTEITLGAANNGVYKDALYAGTTSFFRSPTGTVVTPGEYKLTFDLDGYATIEDKRVINWDDLSVPDAQSGLVIKKLNLTQEFKIDYCSKCDNLLSCLACVDNAVVTSYEK